MYTSPEAVISRITGEKLWSCFFSPSKLRSDTYPRWLPTLALLVPPISIQMPRILQTMRTVCDSQAWSRAGQKVCRQCWSELFLALLLCLSQYWYRQQRKEPTYGEGIWSWESFRSCQNKQFHRAKGTGGAQTGAKWARGPFVSQNTKALSFSDGFSGSCPLQLSNYLHTSTALKQNCLPPTCLLAAEAAAMLLPAVWASPQLYNCWCFWSRAFPPTLHLVKSTKSYYILEEDNWSRLHQFIQAIRDCFQLC